MIPLQEAATYLGISVWRLRKSFMYPRKIDYFKSGNGNYKQQRVYFKVKDLDKLKEGKGFKPVKVVRA